VPARPVAKSHRPARMPRARQCGVPGIPTGKIAWGVGFFIGGYMLTF